MPIVLPAFGGDAHHSHPGKSINPLACVCPHGSQWNSLSVLLVTSFRLLKIPYTEEEMSKHMVVSTRDPAVVTEIIPYNTIPHHTTRHVSFHNTTIVYQSYHIVPYWTISYPTSLNCPVGDTKSLFSQLNPRKTRKFKYAGCQRDRCIACVHLSGWELEWLTAC